MMKIASSPSSFVVVSLKVMRASIVFFWTFAITANLNKEDNNRRSPLFVAARKECGAYLAKSTIPGAGLGLFAGNNFKSGDVMVEGDIAVPIYELTWHNNDEEFVFLWDEYVWGSDLVMNGGNEEAEDSDDVTYASFGIGAAVNCHMNLLNTDTTYLQVDNAGLHRSKDAGAGAIAYAHDRKTIATTVVPAGMELFHTYGDNYFLSRESLYGLIPLKRDFRIADNLLKKFTTLQSELQIQHHSPQLIKDLYTLMVDPGMQSRALNALPGPNEALDIQKAMKHGVGRIERDRSIRDLNWLDENGKCADNLRPGQSNIEGAGRGAFATRSLRKGDVVAPAPLIHLNKNRLMMYDSQPPNSHGNLVRNESAPYSYQLLLNYCFGHRNSTFLLSPYGPLTSLINHSSKNPNVRIEWASNSTFLHPEWKELNLKEVGVKEHAGLSFDYIAIRNIEEGDEILLDYGKEWEEAWNEHVRTWAPPKDAVRYKAAYEMNNDYTSTLWPDHQSPYYPNNVRMTCHSEYLDMWGYQSNHDWETYYCRIVKQYTGTDRGDLYDVEILEITENSDTMETTVEVDGILFGVPRDIIYFEDLPYTRDHYMRNAFRHEMMIPDDVFPSQWHTT